MRYNIEDLTMEEKIGQKIIVGLDGKEALTHLKDIIQKYKVGGVLIYRKNYKDYNEMVELINKIKELNQVNKIPMFISIDQEGGRVNRMPKEFANLPSANKLFKSSQNEDYVKRAGEITGKMLNKTGINMDFAPVLDVKRFGDNHAIGDRAFSENIDDISKYGIEYMKELQKNNVISIVKHFPGHGITSVDTHFGIPKIKKDIETIEHEDMIPFKKAIENKVDGIVVGHLKIKGVTEGVTASISKRFITKYIRKKYRYNGLIVTDDMRMKGTKIRYGKNIAIMRAFWACNDIIVFKYDGDIKILKKIKNYYKENEKEEKKINRSVIRILKVKEKYNVNNEAIAEDENFVEEINKEINEIRDRVIS